MGDPFSLTRTTAPSVYALTIRVAIVSVSCARSTMNGLNKANNSPRKNPILSTFKLLSKNPAAPTHPARSAPNMNASPVVGERPTLSAAKGISHKNQRGRYSPAPQTVPALLVGSHNEKTLP